MAMQSFILDDLLEDDELYSEKINKLENDENYNQSNKRKMLIMMQSSIMNPIAMVIWSHHSWMLEFEA